MQNKGTLLKMKTGFANPVKYWLILGSDEICLNDYLGKKLNLEFQNEIYCISCGRKTKKSFAQGFCYPCFQSSPEASPCILKPELCEAHLGVARDMDWAKQHCLQPHYVYLAVSSAVKVGVTRQTQIPTRWIDQGASMAIKFAQTPYRQLAGEIEVALKSYYTDKTNWQKMLKNDILHNVDLVEEKQKAWELLPDNLKEYVTEDDAITEIKYPVVEYPKKIKSLNFDKTDRVGGSLTGIKGQYLMFDNQFVINIRRHNGYTISIET